MTRCAAKILIVDDQKAICRILQKIFQDQGHDVHIAHSGIQALRVFDTYEFDVVITDINMPDLNGLDLLKEIKKRNQDIPTIMITASQEIQAAKSSFKLGAYDYITKPFDRTEAQMSVMRALDHIQLIRENRDYQQRLESMVNSRTTELQRALLHLEDAYLENRQAHLESIIVLSKIAEVNDEYTGNHIKRVSIYSELLSQSLKLPSKFTEQITYSSPMHDIGKIFVNPAVLKKHGRLNPNEFEEIKMHTIKGAQILEGVPFLQMAQEIALYHHECYDGSGYPYGLKGEAIPMAARLVTVCDVFDALISERCYKTAYSLKTATTILKSETGRRFDPQIVDNFLKIKKSIYKIYRDFRD